MIEGDRERLTFLIEEKSSGRPIGWCTTRTWARKHVSANLGIGLGEKELWDQGYGSEAVNLLIGIVFDHQGWHGAELYTLTENERAIRSAEKPGFRRVGLEREATYYDGAHHDVTQRDQLRSESDARKSARPRRSKRE